MNEIMVALHNERAATYGLLARLYAREVDSDLLVSLRQLQPAAGDEVADQGLVAIVTYLGESHEDPLTELAVDYTRLFIVRSEHGREAAYPFESVYTSKEALVMDKARDEVIELYREVGLTKSPEWKQGEDHISLELEYMSLLAQKTAGAFANGDEGLANQWITQQIAFLRDHLLRWIEPFASAVELGAKTGFYKGVALLTRGYLEQDYACLQEESIQ